jgi:hypothetical protein
MRAIALVLGAALLIGSCGGGSAAPAATSPPARIAAAFSGDWPQFGYDAQRSNASDAPTGVTAQTVGALRRLRISLPGTVDSSPVYVHGMFLLTTTYGRTLALDGASGRILWQFVPSGIGGWEGSYQITNASPAADPDGRHVFAASPDGLVHRLDLRTGREAPGWPVRVTRDPRHEKLGASLGIDGASVVAATGGYGGDAPPYQGHVVTIARSNGRITHLFNTLCADHRRLLDPRRCSASDSAIWSRAGVVVEPSSGRLLIATGNGPYNGRTNFGDSVLELTGGLRLRQAYTPVNQAELNAGDIDLGSSSPALLPSKLALIGGKDGLLRLLDLRRLNGHRVGRPFTTGGELQVLAGPGGQALFAQPAVWHRIVFVANYAGTAAYTVTGRRLAMRWQNASPGTSPIVAGGLLFVYDPRGGLSVYRPASGVRLASLPAGGGHWNSPVIAGGRIALPEGNANDHATSGVLDLYVP